MATNQLRRVLQTLRGATLPHEGEGLPDGQLLECYVRNREEAAFAALVRRHGPMVWGVCRRVLGSHHDAEDAFQAAFLVLVRKAASVVPRAMVANWLYGVARQTALKARMSAARRRAREKQVMAVPEPAVGPQGPRNDLLPLLDQELDRLSAKYRAVIVLCDLEGKTLKEAAGHLRVPPGTVASRLATARAMLGRRLGRHVPGVSGAALAAALSQTGASAGVPPSVVSSTIQAASLFAAGQAAAPGVLSAKAVALTEGVLKTMLLSKLKTATAVLVATAVLGAGAAALTQPVPAGKPADPRAGERQDAADQPLKEKKEGEIRPATVSGVVKAVDAEKSTLTLAAKEGDRTFNVAPDAAVLINGRPGNLAGLRAGARVTLGLAAGRQTARSLDAVGPQVSGVAQAVDADKNTLTVADREGETTFAVARNAQVEIDGKPGKLAVLPPGAVVTLSWFTDQKTARSVQAAGSWWQGVLVHTVDAEKNTITFDVGDKQPAEVNGKTFPVAKDANIRIDGQPGKLADLPPRVFLTLYLCADQKTILGIDAAGPGFQGVRVKAVDAGKNTITFEDDRQLAELAGKTFPVAKGTNVLIDGKPGKLAGLPPGVFVSVTLSADQKTIRGIQAQGPGYQAVLVKAVDAEQNTVTFEDDKLYDKQPAEVAGKTFPVARDANVLTDGKPGKLVGVLPGTFVELALSADQKAVRSLDVRGPSFSNVLVKAVDAGKNTITFGDYPQQPADLAEKTFPVARDAFLWFDDQPGKLAALPPGAYVNLALSVDQKTVRSLSAQGPQVGGSGGAVVQAVDAEKNTITVDVNGEGEKTFPVAKDARIEIDGKRGKLGAVPKEASVILTLCVDQKTIRAIHAKGP
jgi:RNA polymerase sigma factor (sigma-70 family)